MSTPESDRLKRKEALKAARHKLAVRKKQREELRAQRAARLAGKIDTTIATSSSTTTALNTLVGGGGKRQSIVKKQASLLTFMDDFDDIKEDKKSTIVKNKASLLRAPRSRSTLAIGRLKNYNYVPIKTVETWDKWSQTDFDMFSQYLIEEYSEEFPNKESMTDEVKANLILSKYKIGWPKELWIHEKSLSPSPQNLMYDDDEYIEQQKKLQRIRKQEKERKDRQKLLIQQRRKEKIRRKNRKVLPKNEVNLLVNTGTFMNNFRKKTKWMERALGINSIHFINTDNTAGTYSIINKNKDDDTDIDIDIDTDTQQTDNIHRKSNSPLYDQDTDTDTDTDTGTDTDTDVYIDSDTENGIHRKSNSPLYDQDTDTETYIDTDNTDTDTDDTYYDQNIDTDDADTDTDTGET
eukprot:59312_1